MNHFSRLQTALVLAFQGRMLNLLFLDLGTRGLRVLAQSVIFFSWRGVVYSQYLMVCFTRVNKSVMTRLMQWGGYLIRVVVLPEGIGTAIVTVERGGVVLRLLARLE